LNNKIVSIKTTSAIFLAIVLVTGTITTISPSFMITGANAQAQPYYGYNSYGPPEYPDNNYKKSYGNDNNSYDKSQYQSSSYKPDYKPQYPSYVKDDKRDKSNIVVTL